VIALLLLSLAVQQAPSRPVEMRFVIGTDVACRARPDRGAPAVATHTVGEVINVRGAARDATGAEWREVTGLLSPCWVYGPLTVAFDGYRSPDDALIGVADHALALGDAAPFEHLVAVGNLIHERARQRGRYFGAPAVLPPLLELRRLQIIDRAAVRVGGTQATSRDPLKMAWVLAHEDSVAYFEPGDLYYVDGHRFWALHDQRRASPVAEEIAWAAASARVVADECYTDCSLGKLALTYMRYWAAYPGGTHTGDAVGHGIERAAYAARYCPMVAAGELDEDRAAIRAAVGEMRESLRAVAVPAKADLLRHLADIEATCLGRSIDLTDPRAIPQLVKALGSGFTIVARQLALFGEDAAPALLEIVADPASEDAVMRDAVRALRIMLDDSAARPLSPPMRDRIAAVVTKLR
jgi:hypothetical protein